MLATRLFQHSLCPPRINSPSLQGSSPREGVFIQRSVKKRRKTTKPIPIGGTARRRLGARSVQSWRENMRDAAPPPEVVEKEGR